MSNESVALVCMPWHMLGSPSIQIGTLEAVLRRAGIACTSHSLYLAFQDFLVTSGFAGASRFTLDDYGEICSRWMNLGVGDWIFAVPEVRDAAFEKDAAYVELLRANGMPDAQIEKLHALREAVPGFLERCADEILAARPAVVGFSNVYSQAWASVALARTLRARDQDITIVFGGASCEGAMGPALLATFPEIDVVVRGAAEGVIVPLVQSLIAGTATPKLPGLCYRDSAQIVEVPVDSSTQVAMDEIPIPHYDEYFRRLFASSLATTILPQIPFETSRGCWWGMKAHCTFCGLNGLDMKFRSKSPSRVVDELSAQAARHSVLDFTAVDNILDMKYFATLLPDLAAKQLDLGLFYETKANLKEAQVKALKAAGVRAIQPGIESLSTPTLHLMKKGVTAMQNIRLLKWCAVHGVRVVWNLLYGFPGEEPAEYERMADVVPSLAHLEAPSLSALAIYRFSPYHADPAAHGLQLDGPLAHYRLLYDADERVLADLAQAFEHRHVDGRDPASYTGRLRDQVERWNRDATRNRGALTYRRGPGMLIVTDTRTTTTDGVARYTLGEAEARVYLACESGGTLRSIVEELARFGCRTLEQTELEGLLRDMVEARLVYQEGGEYLALALPAAAG
jgi:ribosomal peptide maturation radical SAM protein 1